MLKIVSILHEFCYCANVKLSRSLLFIDFSFLLFSFLTGKLRSYTVSCCIMRNTVGSIQGICRGGMEIHGKNAQQRKYMRNIKSI